jgi:hypothetical protein
MLGILTQIRRSWNVNIEQSIQLGFTIRRGSRSGAFCAQKSAILFGIDYVVIIQLKLCDRTVVLHTS